MFKIEYDMLIGNDVRPMTFDFIFHSAWAAGLKASEIRNALHVNVYVYDISTGELVDYYWGQ